MDGEEQIQVILLTKQSKYAVPGVPYSIAINSTADDLNTLVVAMLNENQVFDEMQFDFLILGEILRTSLSDHLKEKEISIEDVIEIEYIERYPPPEPENSLLHDDWVATVEAYEQWILTGCYDNTINIWNTRGSHILTIPGHAGPVKAVTWIDVNEQQGTFLSCSQDQTIRLWKWTVGKDTAECMYLCKGHERSVDCVSVSPDKQRFATGSWDTMLKIWSAGSKENISEGWTEKNLKNGNIESGELRTPVATLANHRECISSVQWMDQSTILTGSWDHTMKIWDLNLEGVKSEITGNKSFFDACYSHLNHLIVTASPDKNIRVYDPRSERGCIVKDTYFGHSQWVQAVEWSHEEEYLFVSASYDNQVKLWDFRCPKAPLFDLVGHKDKVLDVNWSNSKYIVSGGCDNAVQIFKSRKCFDKLSDV